MKLANILIGTSMFVSTMSYSQTDELEASLGSRLYVSDLNAYSLTFGAQYLGLDWHLGGYIPFHGNDESGDWRAEFDYGVAKRFALTEVSSFVVGLGAISSDMYSDYGLQVKVTDSVRLETGYRYHFANEPEVKHEYYLGMRWQLGGDTSTSSISPVESELKTEEPVVEESVVAEDAITSEMRRFEVSFDSSKSDAIDTTELVNFIRSIEVNNIGKVIVTGHADSSGPEKLNNELSESRARAVKEQLILLGVSPASIEAVGLGARHPEASNASKEGRERNRRAEVNFTVYTISRQN